MTFIYFLRYVQALFALMPFYAMQRGIIMHMHTHIPLYKNIGYILFIFICKDNARKTGCIYININSKKK